MLMAEVRFPRKRRIWFTEGVRTDKEMKERLRAYLPKGYRIVWIKNLTDARETILSYKDENRFPSTLDVT